MDQHGSCRSRSFEPDISISLVAVEPLSLAFCILLEQTSPRHTSEALALYKPPLYDLVQKYFHWHGEHISAVSLKLSEAVNPHKGSPR